MPAMLDLESVAHLTKVTVVKDVQVVCVGRCAPSHAVHQRTRKPPLHTMLWRSALDLSASLPRATMRLSLTPPTAATTLQGDLTLLITDMVAAGSAEGRRLSEESLEASLNAYYLLYAVRPTSHRSAVAS